MVTQTSQPEPESGLEATAQRAASILMARLGAVASHEFAAEIHRALLIADDALCDLHGFSRQARGRYKEAKRE